MYYAIDFDTRSVESKSTDGELLAAYVLDNKLTAAIALVDNEDELCLQLSLNEMQELSNNLGGDKQELSNNLGGDKQYEGDEQAAEWCWRLLEQSQDDIPNFTKALGKRLLKEADKRNRDVPEAMGGPKSRKNTGDANAEASTTKPARKRRTSSKSAGKRPTDATVLTLGKRPTDATVLTLGKQPKESTVLFKVWQTVEDNLGDMSIGDIVAECELDEQQCRKHISRCIRKEVLIKVEEEL